MLGFFLFCFFVVFSGQILLPPLIINPVIDWWAVRKKKKMDPRIKFRQMDIFSLSRRKNRRHVSDWPLSLTYNLFLWEVFPHLPSFSPKVRYYSDFSETGVTCYTFSCLLPPRNTNKPHNWNLCALNPSFCQVQLLRYLPSYNREKTRKYVEPRNQRKKLKKQQITCVFVNTDPTWSLTYCYIKYTGDWAGIAWHTGMERAYLHSTKIKFNNF